MKKQRWEENRDLIKGVTEAQQLEFDDLDGRYKALKQLVMALGECAAQTAEDVLKAGGVGIARPDRLRKLMRVAKKALKD